MARVRCLRCRRPEIVCYCAALPTLPTQTRVVILQHPRERDMPIGTARMATLCLPNSELRVGIDWSTDAVLARALADPARPAILLYPGPDAKDVLTDPPVGPVTLVVVDGTWSQAKVVVRDNPVLQALPRYAFSAPAPSQYRIRKEPRAEYVSTIEALMYVLGALEGRPEAMSALIAPLNAMVDAQIAAQSGRPRRLTRQVLRAKPPRPYPPGIGSRAADLVCVAGEANSWPYVAEPGQPAATATKPRDELVHWTAVRVATGECFSAVIVPRGAIAPSTAFHVDLPEDTLLAGGTMAAAREAFARFVRPTDIIAAWGHYSPGLWLAAGGELPAGPDARLDLRAEVQARLHRRIGSVEVLGAGLREPARELAVPGRAGRRLTALAAITRQLPELGVESRPVTLANVPESIVA